MKSLGAYYFLYYLALSAFLPYVSINLSDKGFSSTAIGMILSLWALVGVISQPIMGMMNDRLQDRRNILLICTVVSPLVALGFYFFDGYFAIIVFSVLFSWFQSTTGPLSDALAIEIGNREGFSFGSIRLWGALSYSLGTFCTGFVYERFGYDKSILCYLLLHVFVLVTLLFFPKMKPSSHKISMFNQAKQVFLNKSFMLFVGVCLLITTASAINFNFLPIYFKEMGFEKSWIGTAYAIAAMIEVPMFWVSAKLNRKIGRIPVLCIAAIFYAAKCLTLSMSHNVYPVLAVQLFDGISFAFFASAAVETVDTFSSSETKATFQTVFAAITSGLGGIIGSLFGGIIVDQMGVSFLYLMLFLLCFAASLFFVIFQMMSRKTAGTIKKSTIRQL